MAKIKLVQVYCQARHLIAGLAFDPERNSEAETKRFLSESLDRKNINACGTCETRDLYYETVQTDFDTVGEAGRSVIENNNISFIELHKKLKLQKPVPVPLLKCVRCGIGVNRNKQGRSPREGDVSICNGCGQVMRFRADLSLHPLAGEELTELKTHLRIHQPETLRMLEQAVAHFVAGRARREN